MGCFVSALRNAKGKTPNSDSLGEVAIFTPGLRIPKAADLSLPISRGLPKPYLERLSSLRTRIIDIAVEEAPSLLHGRRTERETQLDGSSLSNLWQSIEEYLPVLLVLVKDGSQPTDSARFVWINQWKYSKETCISCAWYEVLSLLHLMAISSLLDLNLLFLPKPAANGYPSTVPEESKRDSIDVFLKAAGYVDFAVSDVLPRIPLHLRKDLPPDLSEGVLRALCQQALAQAVDIQLGIAIDSPKATMAVKRRLACEMLKHWQQAHENVSGTPFDGGWCLKYQLYVKWKFVEAKAVAYYFHGMILNEGSMENSPGASVVALRIAEEFLKESLRACEAFNNVPPLSRSPPLWGTMKYLIKKIPGNAQSKMQSDRELRSNEALLRLATSLPDFSVALKPDEYKLPSTDSSWNEEDQRKDEGENALTYYPGCGNHHQVKGDVPISSNDG